MSLNNLLDKKLQFILFGGKGGVGKTSMSAASSIMFADNGKKTLLFTTDPAPSLADSFGQELSNKPTAIKGVDNLFAMEINAQEVLQEFKEKYGEDILDILQKGTYLDENEAEEMFKLDIPGLDEVMGLKKITDFMENKEYDLYIVDTAPTGHTLRLLTLPDLLDNWIKFLANLRWRYRYMVERFSGKETIEKADEFLLEMKKTVKKVKSLLQDESKTEFAIVTIPEAMGVLETEDLVKILKESNIPSDHIIVNNIFPKSKCDFCAKRWEMQSKYIKTIKDNFSEFDITEIELQPQEIRGLDALKKLGKSLFHS